VAQIFELSTQQGKDYTPKQKEADRYGLPFFPLQPSSDWLF
jgi:hypothetical protein